MIYIFDKAGNYIATSNNDVNTDDLATRGEIAITSDNIFNNPFFDGVDIIDRPTQPSKYHTWNGTEWVISEEKEAELLALQQAETWERIKEYRYQRRNLLHFRGGR